MASFGSDSMFSGRIVPWMMFAAAGDLAGRFRR